MSKLIVKVTSSPDDIRRYTFQQRPSFDEFRQVILPTSGSFNIKYLDDEQDLISLTNERELSEAWELASSSQPAILRITLVPKPVETKFFHRATCDACNQMIIGKRFKCLNCPDYDLCERCEPSKVTVHDPTHGYVEIVRPLPHLRPSCGPWRRGMWQRVVCDGCQKEIQGDRYKCKNCPNYDLCADCEPKKAEIHDATHEFDKSFFSCRGMRKVRWLNHPGANHPMPFRGCRFARMNFGQAPTEEENKQEVNQEEIKQEEIKQEEIKQEVVEPSAPVQQQEEVKQVEEPEVQEQEEELKVQVEDVNEEDENPEEEAKPEDSEEEQKEEVKQEQPEDPVEGMLKTLEDMGFCDRETNLALLNRNGFDIVFTIHQLLNN